jgi:hypothetical protein
VGLRTDRELIGAAILPFVLLVPTAGFMYRIGFVHAFLFVCLSAAAGPAMARVTKPRRAVAMQDRPIGLPKRA